MTGSPWLIVVVIVQVHDVVEDALRTALVSIGLPFGLLTSRPTRFLRISHFAAIHTLRFFLPVNVYVKPNYRLQHSILESLSKVLTIVRTVELVLSISCAE